MNQLPSRRKEAIHRRGKKPCLVDNLHRAALQPGMYYRILGQRPISGKLPRFAQFFSTGFYNG